MSYIHVPFFSFIKESCFLISKSKNLLHVQHIFYDKIRIPSTLKLINETDKIYNFKDFDWVMINCGDICHRKKFGNLKVLSYSTLDDDYNNACPDFIFDHWNEVQIPDYEYTIEEISKLGNILPETNLLGWRGARTHENRNKLDNFKNNLKYDIKFINWDKTNPNKFICNDYVSLFDHVKKWRFLIDIEGHGWSARTKLFFFSKRVLFLVDRPYKEWYYENLIPWKHYVPVKRDLSDLEENYDKILSDKNLEDYIRYSAFDFAINNLKRKHAFERWNFLLSNLK